MGNKSLVFVLLAAIFSIMGHLKAHGAERYAATVEDGTAKVIRANSVVDENRGSDEYIGGGDEEAAPAPKKVTSKQLPASAPKALKAPKKISHQVKMAEDTVTADAATTDLARENAELKKRVSALEKAKAEARAAREAEVAAEEAPAEEAATAENTVDATEETAQAQDVAAGATEATEMPAEAMEPAAAPVKKAAPKAAPKAIVASKKPVAAPIVAAAPEAKPEVKPEIKKEKFDSVPDQHVAEIAMRLKYTNEILKRFGRAYDYRSTTLTEFKKILADLESAEEKSAQAN